MTEPTTHTSPPTDRRDGDRLLVRAARRGGVWIVLLVITALGIAAAELALPAVLGRAVDGIVDREGWTAWALAAVLLVAALVALDALDDLAVGAATANATAWLRHGLLRHVLAAGPAGEFASGDVAARITGNAADAGRAGPDGVRAVVALVPALGAIVALALIDVWLCATFLVGLPLLVLAVRSFTRDATGIAARYLEVQGAIAARLEEALAGARTIAASRTADREVERVLAPLPDLRRHGFGMWRAQTRIAVQDVLLVALLEVAVLAVAGVLLARGRISAGELLAAGQYALLGATLGAAMASAARIAQARAAAGRLAEVLAQPVPSCGRRDLPPGPGRLEFRGVTVRSGDHTLLDTVDLDIAGGSLVAVVGRSGAGKSVLAALAGRLVEPEEGAVLLDGVALRDVSPDALRREVACAFERPALFGATVADAVAFGAHEPPPAELEAAAQAARADEFVRRLPQGYATPLAEAPMSGGEAQRLGLARAFAHAGRLLVLDDVTASLDTITEHHIGRVLTGPMGGRTRLIVAHRATTAARVDVVVWLEDGRVRAVAPHALLWDDADYRAVFAT